MQNPTKIEKYRILAGHDQKSKRKSFPVYLELEIEIGHPTTAPYLNTNLEDIRGKMVAEISICGECRADRRGDFVYAGQIIDEIENNKNFNAAIPEAKLARILEIWKNYHCGGITPGTEKQMEALREFKHKTNWYTEACSFLKENGLYEDRGYKFGEAWLFRETPTEIVKEIRELFVFTKGEKS